MIGRDEKIRLIDQVIRAAGVRPWLTNFLRVLARHDRLDLLPADSAGSAHSAMKSAAAGSACRSRSRVAPRPTRPKRASASGWPNRFPFDPILETQVDPSLIGRNCDPGRRHRLR